MRRLSERAAAFAVIRCAESCRRVCLNLRREIMRVETERKMKRWREQRWLLDQVIHTRGLDWDQGRTGKILRNCGPGVEGELREIGRRIQKFSDIPREFSRAAL